MWWMLRCAPSRMRSERSKLESLVWQVLKMVLKWEMLAKVTSAAWGEGR